MPLTYERARTKDERTGPPELQHRHYAFMAGVIATLDHDIRLGVAAHFANACVQTNPRFDRERFMTACKVKG